jgi:hypothetical protein
MSFVLPLAHGIGQIQDLPIPRWLFYYGAALVLIVSFVALGILWREPRLSTREAGRPLNERWQRFLLWRGWPIILGGIALGLLVVVWLAALVGRPDAADNLAPVFVWVLFWLGLVPIVVIFGNLWSVLNPWKAGADALAWAWAKAGREWEPAAAYPEWLGRWPAAALLFAFATLELAWPRSAEPRTLALAIVVYSWVTWAGMLLFGRRAWLENGEAFSVYFGLLSRISPFAMREVDGRRRVVVRPPLAGLASGDSHHGTVAFVAVMLGSVAFDGFTRVTWWQDELFELEARYIVESPTKADLAHLGFNLLGLLAAVMAIGLMYSLAVLAAKAIGHTDVKLAGAFIGSLIPIALAYSVAHYFTLLVDAGQDGIYLASDPFGKGWDLFGTADFRPTENVFSPNTIWYVQVGVLVTGHVLGLVLAHDRAISLFKSARTAIRTQYAMLALMVLYTCTGLWLLSSG